MVEQIISIAARWNRKWDACGIGFGGPVEFDKQRIALSTHVGGWSNFDLPGQLERQLGVLPVMDNDANVGALGEATLGAGKCFRPLFYVTLSTGIGGGLILDRGGGFQAQFKSRSDQCLSRDAPFRSGRLCDRSGNWGSSGSTSITKYGDPQQRRRRPVQPYRRRAGECR